MGAVCLRGQSESACARTVLWLASLHSPFAKNIRSLPAALFVDISSALLPVAGRIPGRSRPVAPGLCTFYWEEANGPALQYASRGEHVCRRERRQALLRAPMARSSFRLPQQACTHLPAMESSPPVPCPPLLMYALYFSLPWPALFRSGSSTKATQKVVQGGCDCATKTEKERRER